MSRDLNHKRKTAFITLSIENVAAHIWRIFFWILLFCGLWMLGLPMFFGQIFSVLISGIFLAGIIYFIKNDVLSFEFPKEKEIITALEKRSGFARGHISLLNDELANSKTHNTRDLWKKAQKEVASSLKYLKTPLPRHIITRRDPAALRLIAVLVFISGLLVSGNNWQHDIHQGIMPISMSGIISQGRDTNIWIKPPEYTQIGQTHLIGGGEALDKVLDIPEGSKIRIRTHSILGEFLAPKFYNGYAIEDMDYIGDGLYGIETTIEKGDRLFIKQGLITRAAWDYNFIIDQPPEIKLPPLKEDAKAYELMDKGQIRFPLIVKDDYGVKELYMSMDIDKIVSERPLGSPVSEMRLIMSQPNMEFKIAPIYELAWHSWAGLPVTFEYSARDHKGQIATLEKIRLTLPEQEFKHPMAKSIIAMRKNLAWNYDDSFLDISRNLEILLSAPDYFQNDITVYLAVRSASSRLFYSNEYEGSARKNAAKEVIKLLWDVALVIEEGDLSLAMRELRAAQRKLENAMNDPNATDREIAAIMDELREKMANYFAEMQRAMQKSMANGEMPPQLSADDFGQLISPNALSTLMAQIESALKSGDNQKAQELMAQLQRMMEMVDPSMSAQLPMDMQAMREGVNELQELIDSQELLLEQTKIIIDSTASKIEQEALRYILGQLMLDISEKLDEIPKSMGKAEQEMRLSEHALGENTPHAAIKPQEQAITHLKNAQEELSQQFKQRMQQMVGISFSARRKLDPLGRALEDPSNDVKLPDEAQRRQVDEILRTLRDRSGDLNRPDEELDYFRRLLRQF